MSIATDVSRIKGNITAALAAIADKGVTVPDGSTSDALASLIASIEAGGGGGDTILGYNNFLSGTITLAEESTDVIILVEGEQFKEDTYAFCALWDSNIKVISVTDNSHVGVSALTGGTSFGLTSKGSNAYNQKIIWANNTGALKIFQYSSYTLAPGVTYCWIMLYKT